MKKKWIIPKFGIIVLAISMLVNFPFSASAAEEKKTEASGIAENMQKQMKNTEEPEGPEEAEEDTMLNIMPSLTIPKTPSLKYSIAQEFEYNDNFYLEKGGKKKGRFSSITSPTVSVEYPIGRVYLQGVYDYGFVYYMREEETISRQTVEARIYHRPTKRLSMGLTERFLRDDLVDQEDIIDVKVAGKTFDNNKLAAQVKYEINKEWRIGADGSYSFIYFEETPSDAVPSNVEFGGGVNTEYVIDRRTTLGLFYSCYDTVVTEDEDQKDSLKHDLRISYYHKIRQAFAVDAYAGYDFVHYNEGEDASGAVAGAKLQFDISRFTMFILEYRYDLNNSTKKDSLAYRGHSFHANLDHKITPRLVVNLLSSYDMWGYDSKYDISSSGSKSDKQSYLMGFEGSLNYKLTKKIDIGATYKTSAKFSDFSNDEYFNNVYLVSVRATF